MVLVLVYVKMSEIPTSPERNGKEESEEEE